MMNMFPVIILFAESHIPNNFRSQHIYPSVPKPLKYGQINEAATSILSKMNDTPSVALFDLRFKDSLPPIASDLMEEKKRGDADGEEEWIASSHYER